MGRLLETIASPADLKKLPVEELPALCEEIRAEIIQTCANNGGHLGSSLGAVEINVALHYVYASPQDKLVFDVGHQAYAHKLLTGRRERFRTIRTEGGLAGFPERHESEYDAFGVGHASTAISAALGMIEAKRMTGAPGKVVALVGDGAMTGGVAFEGLNQAGYLKRDLLVVLNDNEMSISPNVGAMSEWLSKKFASRTYNRWRKSVKEFLASVPKGPQAIEMIRHGINATKALVTPGILFEGLGFHYVGPVDGHDVKGLVESFQKLATFDGPVLLHAITTKGKGYQPAEADKATRGHGLSFFDVATGKPVKKPSTVKAYTDLFADALCDEMERNPRVVAITAAMLEGTGLIKAKQRFPDRTYDVGIAEQHAVTFAAGLACDGVRPVVAIYSTFLQRAYDQIIHDVALQKLPVTFALDRGGLVGADGKTHQGAFDLAYLRCVPNLLVMAPSDENEMRHMLHTSLQHEGAAAFRYPRGSGEGVALEPPRVLEIGKGRLARNVAGKPDVCVVSIGTTLKAALVAAEALAKDGMAVTVVDARFVKPIDEELVCTEAARAKRVVTVEEGCLPGGFGAACLEAFERRGLVAGGLAVRRLGIPDEFITHAEQAKQRAWVGIDADAIAAACRALVGDRKERGAA
ncbi:1-deoxy-D-xylulose-5-phosphate synthase [Anaeromyxobacter oryzae]|uniref:1-deoxy-D-xylulose-5-phosphate synthase n=1 Tax=Anaeromyxobacter oryzae TaxID=2918170 RepID=A0ABN6MLX3_9BACT|nr:1-deoxy-D-xylulose-5-phosphate synthase [Anaeromyxobacter oryzae]BDG02034.1 1-deoxy-D-xylulose-5-phosphate synthase 1 [Anaeromyxobacter oryzae]